MESTEREQEPDRNKDDYNHHYRLLKRDIPIGFRFCPTIDETFQYLKMRVSSQPIQAGIFHECDVYERQPSDLPAGFENDDNKYAYFFTHRDKMNMNPNAKNQKRTTRDSKGSWKATSRPIHYADGKKNTLVYHLKTEGTKLHKKTNWIMHEFVLHDYSTAINPQDKNMVLCRIYERNDESAKRKNQQNLVPEEENRMNIDRVEAQPRPIPTLKRKGRAVEQSPHVSEELGNYHHQYYITEPVPSQPKMAQYSPTHYTSAELEPASTGGSSSHGYQFQINQVGVPLSDRIPSCSYANTSDQFLLESLNGEFYPCIMSGSSLLWPITSRDEPLLENLAFV